jgi:uncharacterized protein YjbI with pentapeptide repeats
MKAAIFFVITLWVSSASAFDPAHVERLRNTGICAKCDLSDFKFPDKANLRGADLSGANLRGANLVDASLSGANLTGANLSGSSLEGVINYKRF